MFKFDIQRFDGGTDTTNIPASYADRSKFPGLDTSTNQQMQYNDLASLVSQGLMGQALNSMGYKVTQNQSPTVANYPAATPTTSTNNGWQWGGDWEKERTVNTLRDAIKTGTKAYDFVGIVSNTEDVLNSYKNQYESEKNSQHALDNWDAYVNEAKLRAFGTPYTTQQAATSSSPTYTMDTSSRIGTPNWNQMYQTGINDMNKLTSGYGSWADGMQGQLNGLNTKYADWARENANETRDLQGRYDALGATNTAENNALRGRYDALGATNTSENNALRSRYDANMADYNTKMNGLQNGVIPQTFTDTQQRILNRSANEAVGNLLTSLGQTGAINSSLGRRGIGDISYNVTKEMDNSYLDNIDRLSNMANQQYGNVNAGLDANGNLIQRNFTNGMGVLDANGNLIQRNFTNGMGVLDANGNLIQQRFTNGYNTLGAMSGNLKDQFNMGQTAYGTKMNNISAPMSYTAAALEAQDAPLLRLVQGANTANQYPFNFWNANNASWSNMNTPEQTVVTQNQGIGSALGGLAGLATKFVK